MPAWVARHRVFQKVVQDLRAPEELGQARGEQLQDIKDVFYYAAGRVKEQIARGGAKSLEEPVSCGLQLFRSVRGGRSYNAKKA
eukprot:3706845-Pyramimonas_sp.AAC.1